MMNSFFVVKAQLPQEKCASDDDCSWMSFENGCEAGVCYWRPFKTYSLVDTEMDTAQSQEDPGLVTIGIQRVTSPEGTTHQVPD